MVSDKMVEGSDRYEIMSHALAGANCDCGYTVRQTYTASRASSSQYNTRVVRVHNPKD
jgi:hypothetical protein